MPQNRSSFLTAASVGSITKKILAINPDLPIQDIIAIVKSSSRKQGGNQDEFANSEIIDEAQALELARASLR